MVVAHGLYLARHLFTLYLVVVTEHKCKDVLCVDEFTHCWFRHNLYLDIDDYKANWFGDFT